MNKNNPQIKITGVEPIFESKFLSCYMLNYTDKTGKAKKWYCCSRLDFEAYTKMLREKSRKPDAALICPYHEELDKIVMIRQFRLPIGDYIYEVPAGLVENGENPDETASRELKEETGLTLTKICRKEKNLYASPGFTDESFDMYYVRCTGKATNDFNESSEDIEVLFLSQEQVKALLDSDCKFDAKAKAFALIYSKIGKALFEQI